MTVQESRRVALHRAAAQSWGEEVADTLVELVTPAGHEMATRADTRAVLSSMHVMEQRWDERISAMEQRWDERIGAMDDRTSAMEQRWDERMGAMDDRFEQRLTVTEHRLTAAFERGLRGAITAQTRVIVVSLLVALVTIAGLAIGLG